MTQKELVKKFVMKKNRKLEAEDLFYTSSKFRFKGSFKLWIGENDSVFFGDHKHQETNFFVSKNRTVNSKNISNTNQDKINLGLLQPHSDDISGKFI